MPFVEILACGVSLSPERKRGLLRSVAATVHRVLGSAPAQIRVVVHEVPPENVLDGAVDWVGNGEVEPEV